MTIKAYKYLVEYYIPIKDLEKYPGIHESPKEEVTLAEAVFAEEREITENVKAALNKLHGDNTPETPLNDWCVEPGSDAEDADGYDLYLSIWARQDNADTWKLIQEAFTLPVEIIPIICMLKSDCKEEPSTEEIEDENKKYEDMYVMPGDE